MNMPGARVPCIGDSAYSLRPPYLHGILSLGLARTFTVFVLCKPCQPLRPRRHLCARVIRTTALRACSAVISHALRLPSGYSAEWHLSPLAQHDGLYESQTFFDGQESKLTCHFYHKYISVVNRVINDCRRRPCSIAGDLASAQRLPEFVPSEDSNEAHQSPSNRREKRTAQILPNKERIQQIHGP